MDLPNMLGGFELDGICRCADCWKPGKAKELIQNRKLKQRQHAAFALVAKKCFAIHSSVFYTHQEWKNVSGNLPRLHLVIAALA